MSAFRRGLLLFVAYNAICANFAVGGSCGTDVTCGSGEKNTGMDCDPCNAAVCCLPKTGCRALTQSDVGPSIEVPTGCLAGMDGFCDFGTGSEACGQQGLTPVKICKVQCAQGYVCRDNPGSSACLDKPLSSDGWLNQKPSSSDTTELSFLYFCLCGSDCWDATRTFTPYRTPPCIPATSTSTITTTLPTPTSTYTETLTETTTYTLPTVTPSEPEDTSPTTSTLTCTPHSNTEYHTGKPLTCVFTARDPTSTIVRGDGRKVTSRVLSSFTGGTTVSESVAVQSDLTKGVYTITLPPIASEGSYLVEAVLTSEEWSGFAVRLTAALPVVMGYAEGVSVACVRILPNGTSVTDTVFADCMGSEEVARAASDVPSVPAANYLYVGSRLLCTATPTAAACANCRLRLPLTLSLGSALWSTDTKLAVSSEGVASTTSPQPVLYRFGIWSDVLEERVLQFGAAVGGSPDFITTTEDPSSVDVSYAFRFGAVTSGRLQCPSMTDIFASEDTEDVRTCLVHAADQCEIPTLPTLDAPNDYALSITYTARNQTTTEPFTLLNRTHTTVDGYPVTQVPVAAMEWATGELEVLYQTSLAIKGDPAVGISSYQQPSALSGLTCNKDLLFQGDSASCVLAFKDEWGNDVRVAAEAVGWQGAHISITSVLIEGFTMTFRVGFGTTDPTFDVTQVTLRLFTEKPAVENFTIATHTFTLSPRVDPHIEFYIDSQYLPSSTFAVLPHKDLSISASIAGPGTSSATFLSTAKTFMWNCTSETTASFTYPVASLPTSGNFSCTVEMQYDSETRSAAFVVGINSFESAGSVATNVTTFSSAESAVQVTCEGFTDSHGPLQYHVVEVGDTGAEVGLGEGAMVDVYPPRVSTAEYTFKVACLAADTLGSSALSTNVIELTVPTWVPPETPTAQDSLVVSMITSVTTTTPTLLSLARTAQTLLRLDLSSPVALINAASTVATTLSSTLGTSTLQAVQTSQVAGIAADLFATVNAQHTQTASQTSHEAARQEIAKVLSVIKVGDNINAAGRSSLGSALAGLFEGLKKSGSANTRTAQVLLAQAAGAEMAITAMNLICGIGVSSVVGSPYGTCVTHTQAGVYQLQACATDVYGAETASASTGVSGSFQFSKLDHLSTPISKSAQIIQVVALIEGSPFAFDATSKPLLGAPTLACVYDRANSQFLTADTTLMDWTLPVTPISGDGYSFAFDAPNGAVFTAAGWSTSSCTAGTTTIPSPVSAFTVQCSSLSNTMPTVIAVVATRDVCSPSYTQGCIATNGLMADCKCTRCGSGYITTPINNGLSCQLDLRYRCNSDSTTTVVAAEQCEGNSFLQNGRCTCASGYTCRGDSGPGVCVADKVCDAIGQEYECVESGLMHDITTQKCLCPPVSGAEVYCDAGVCKELLGCGSAGTNSSCGYGSFHNEGVCECRSTHYCDAAEAVPTCKERAMCQLHPTGGEPTCAFGLVYDTAIRGLSKGTATRLSFVLTAESTSPVQPVTDDSDVSVLDRKVRQFLATEELGPSIGLPIVRREVPTVPRTQATFISFILKKNMDELETDTLLTKILAGIGVTLGVASSCFHEADVARGLLCVYTTPPMEIAREDETLPGSCECPDEYECNEAHFCTCPVCKNGGVCEWPTLGVDHHNCTCLTNWKGADCSLREDFFDHFIDVTFPHASYSAYEALSEGEQEAFKANASSSFRSLLVDKDLAFDVFVHEGSLVVSYQLTLPGSLFESNLLNLSLGTLALLLTNSLHIATPLVMANAKLVPQDTVCPRVSGCVGVPVHWTTPPCACLVCEEGMMQNPDKDNTECVPDTLCESDVCSNNGVPSGYVALGCSCRCSEYFVDTEAGVFCSHDTCLDNDSMWQQEGCGGVRCGSRYDHRTKPGDNVGECLLDEDTEFGVTQMVAIIIAGLLCLCILSLSLYYGTKGACPWESPYVRQEDGEESVPTEMVELPGTCSPASAKNMV